MDSPPGSERGFILIAAIWLLILCGSITAVLTLRAVAGYRAADAAGDAFSDTLALDAALETVLADLLFKGQASRWALLPAEGTISGGGGEVAVRVTSELGRIDVNEADPELLDRLLRSVGVETAERQSMIARIAIRRSTRQPISSWDELRPLLGDSGQQAAICVEPHLTMFSGLSAPQPVSMPPALAAALGSAAPAGAVPLAPGTPLRIELRLASGAALTAWARITGLLHEPYAVIGFQRRPVCG